MAEENLEKQVETTEVEQSAEKKTRKAPGTSTIVISSRKCPPKGKGKRLTPSQQAQAKEMWASGEVTLEFLSEKFGIRVEALSRMFKRHGVTKGSKAQVYVEKAATAAQEHYFDNATNLFEKRSKFKEDQWKFHNALLQVTWGIIVEKRKAGTLTVAEAATFDKMVGGAEGVMKSLGITPEQAIEATRTAAQKEAIEIIVVDDEQARQLHANRENNVEAFDDYDEAAFAELEQNGEEVDLQKIASGIDVAE